jgi:hypothetical protein
MHGSNVTISSACNAPLGFLYGKYLHRREVVRSISKRNDMKIISYLTVGVLKVVEIRAHKAGSGTSAKSRASKDGCVHGWQDEE